MKLLSTKTRDLLQSGGREERLWAFSLSYSLHSMCLSVLQEPDEEEGLSEGSRDHVAVF